MSHKRVTIESPYACPSCSTKKKPCSCGRVEKHLAYLRAAMRDCFDRGEIPFASHALYTQPGVLDDDNPDERKLGIEGGFSWASHCHHVAFYCDMGWSRGMRLAKEHWHAKGKRVHERYLGGPWPIAFASMQVECLKCGSVKHPTFLCGVERRDG